MAKFTLNDISGFTKEEAIEVLDKNKVEYRILRDDDQHYIFTTEYNLKRVNMVIEKNLVTECWWG